MRRKCKSNYRRTVLRLPDLDHSKLAVLNDGRIGLILPRVQCAFASKEIRTEINARKLSHSH